MGPALDEDRLMPRDAPEMNAVFPFSEICASIAIFALSSRGVAHRGVLVPTRWLERTGYPSQASWAIPSMSVLTSITAGLPEISA